MDKILITYDYTKTFRTILNEKLNPLGLKYKLVGINEIVFEDSISSETLVELKSILEPYGISITEDENLALIDKIKSAINDMLEDENSRRYNSSDYLSEKLNYSYAYLSSLFSETTYSSIESYIILCKVDKAKELLIKTDLTLTEIAFRLNYSSVAHLSRQFKKTTGLTPSSFEKIINKRDALKTK